MDRMDGLKTTIKRLLDATNKSQRLGELGEKIACENLEMAFPGDTFKITAQEGHVGDIRAQFNTGKEFREARNSPTRQGRQHAWI